MVLALLAVVSAHAYAGLLASIPRNGDLGLPIDPFVMLAVLILVPIAVRAFFRWLTQGMPKARRFFFGDDE